MQSDLLESSREKGCKKKPGGIRRLQNTGDYLDSACVGPGFSDYHRAVDLYRRCEPDKIQLFITAPIYWPGKLYGAAVSAQLNRRCRAAEGRHSIQHRVVPGAASMDNRPADLHSPADYLPGQAGSTLIPENRSLAGIQSAFNLPQNQKIYGYIMTYIV